MVKIVFFLLGGFSNLMFHFWVADHNEIPWLLIGSARRCTRDPQTILDHLAWDGTAGELTHRSPAQHVIAKCLDAILHLIGGVFAIGCQGQEHWFGHQIHLLSPTVCPTGWDSVAIGGNGRSNDRQRSMRALAENYCSFAYSALD